ncbi:MULTISPECIES: hypothetical protein [Mycobacterium]|uniref:HNH endonuclease n=2 Tax=Mycobacterium TaxID=1763 RepID=A0A2G5PQG3_MYCCE|nr:MULTISPECIES: hypothetical protein [Mycobacterium]EID12945.1 hypothetical protein MXEN_12081 [Mycobacterium xenopi RIVM700367]MCV7232774.1 hypothetical protein [Mycobacterium branderi]ORA40912.1 hypothetical protein BST20_01830 [Mycobacterium branderi]PIB80551.1 hypothetical protein CQY23_03150 [Mycobacterium celatum]BBZ09873.1 hypothetical protein MBRA_00680 [Mycobacterium branderi]
MPGRHTKTTTQRGLGHRHKQQVAHLKRQHIDGTPCWWCGEPMYLSQGLAGDHSVPRATGGKLADRLLHGPCNSERGDGSRDHLRPALTGKRANRELVDIGPRALQWPW